MSARLSLAAPLPECSLCENPVRRDVFEINGGLCTLCADGVRAAAERLPAAPGAYAWPGESWVEVDD